MWKGVTLTFTRYTVGCDGDLGGEIGEFRGTFTITKIGLPVGSSKSFRGTNRIDLDDGQSTDLNISFGPIVIRAGERLGIDGVITEVDPSISDTWTFTRPQTFPELIDETHPIIATIGTDTFKEGDCFFDITERGSAYQITVIINIEQ